MAQDNGIEFENVSYSYGKEDGEPALDDVSLRIAAGEFVCVVGANGSGKSTLAKHVNALLIPDSGTVRAAGFDTADSASTLEVRRRVGMVFQNPDNQSVAPVVRDDVAFGPENLGVPADEIRQRVTSSLRAVGMEARADDEVHALSGGQKQLVAIAGVLAMEPQVLVLDEPGAMLDVRGRSAVMRIVRDLHEKGLTILLVTHFMEDAFEADHVIALDAGRIALDGPASEVLADAERLRALHLEPPFSVDLANRLRERGIPVGSEAGIGEEALIEELCLARQDSAGKCSDYAVLRKSPAAKPNKTDEKPLERAPKRSFSLDSSPDSRKTVHSEQNQGARCRNSPLVFENVIFSYGDGHLAVRDLSFELEPGEILGIVGHTGSGKSTVTQLMNALLVPTCGSVAVDGMDTAQRKLRREIRRRVGLVFQYPETQLFATTVAEDVAFGPKNLGFSGEELERKCSRALARVGLDYAAFAERSPFELSGGQQRRVAIAGVLAMEPKVLVLDEPAAGLDPQGVRGMCALLRRLNEEGTTIAIVSHSMDEVAWLCDRVLVMDEGGLFALGGPEQVFSRESAERLQGIGLGLPRATAFALELERRGVVLEGPVLTAGQLAGAIGDAFGRKA